MKRPIHLLDAWNRVAPRLARQDLVALLTDFDGTLVPIARRPAGARLAPRTRQLLEELAHSKALVAVISGRRLSDLQARVAVPGVWYAGEHGHFIAAPDGRKFALASPSETDTMAAVGRRVFRALASEPGILVERKSATVSVHYRGARAPNVRRAKRVVDAVIAGEPGLRLLSGKKVWELMAPGSVDKSTALRFILHRACCHPRTLVFLGDDATDEAAFRRMRGISVIVGAKPVRTAARFWLASPAEVREFFARCLRLWARDSSRRRSR